MIQTFIHFVIEFKKADFVFTLSVAHLTEHGRPYMSHLKAKIKRPVFQRTRQSKDRDLYYALVGFVYSAILLPKRQNQITFRTMLKNFNMKNIEMRPPVPLFNLFKKSNMIK